MQNRATTLFGLGTTDLTVQCGLPCANERVELASASHPTPHLLWKGVCEPFGHTNTCCKGPAQSGSHAVDGSNLFKRQLQFTRKPGVSFVVKLAGLGPQGPEFEPLSAIELTPSALK